MEWTPWNSTLGGLVAQSVELSPKVGSPSWEFEWNGALAIPLWEAVWLIVQNPTTWADSPGQFFSLAGEGLEFHPVPFN